MGELLFGRRCQQGVSDARRLRGGAGAPNEPEVPVEVREGIAPALTSPDLVLGAQPPRSARFTSPTSVVVSCHVPDRSVSAWIFSTARRTLFFEGR
jgi:hypothetical protein